MNSLLDLAVSYGFDPDESEREEEMAYDWLLENGQLPPDMSVPMWLPED